MQTRTEWALGLDALSRASAGCVRAAIDAARERRTADFLACFAPDVEFWMPGTTAIAGRWSTLDGFIEYATKVLEGRIARFTEYCDTDLVRRVLCV